MLTQWRVSKTIQWVVRLFIIYLCLFTAFRLAIVFLFKPKGIGFFSLFPSYWLGLKYDLRWIAIALSPIIVISVYKKFSPFHSALNKNIYTIYLTVLTLTILLFYGADFGNFSYNHTRIAASALNFKDDPYEMFRMVWESYPVVWILAGIAFAVFIAAKLFSRSHLSIETRSNGYMFARQRRWHLLALLISCWFIYGFCCLKPLTRQEAYQFNDNFKSYLALNPFQNFTTTLQFRNPDRNTAAAARYYPVIADFLQLDSAARSKNIYKRSQLPGKLATNNKPNVVLVLCESFSMYKSSMSGNKLNSTPYFNEMCKQGIFFDHCFTPTFGTARGLFATLTGIPDVQMAKFSTQNEEAVNQRTIVNSFEGYKRFYFIGGRSQFNNFNSLVNNVEGVGIYDEGKFHSPLMNVWGISDRDLLMEANDVLKQQHDPFFAIIQTAQNHRPFMLPPGENEFTCPVIEKEMLLKYGFDSQAEFEAFCYTDYCFKKFMESAKQQPYYKNTLFVFVGDHGVEGDAAAEYPAAWNTHRLSDEHVPLLYYAPSLLSPVLYKYTVSQIDLLPTLAGILRQPCVNTTLGRDLINQTGIQHAAFIIHHDEGNIGIVTDDYYFVKNINFEAQELVPLRENSPRLTAGQSDSIKQRLSQLSSAIYETSKWMLVNNKSH